MKLININIYLENLLRCQLTLASDKRNCGQPLAAPRSFQLCLFTMAWDARKKLCYTFFTYLIWSIGLDAQSFSINQQKKLENLMERCFCINFDRQKVALPSNLCPISSCYFFYQDLFGLPLFKRLFCTSETIAISFIRLKN
jgi:hypothetical protein